MERDNGSYFRLDDQGRLLGGGDSWSAALGPEPMPSPKLHRLWWNHSATCKPYSGWPESHRLSWKARARREILNSEFHSLIMTTTLNRSSTWMKFHSLSAAKPALWAMTSAWDICRTQCVRCFHSAFKNTALKSDGQVWGSLTSSCVT